MSIYAIGDIHLSLSPDVDKPMDGFGPLWKNHVQRLHDHWLERIRPSDTVIIPGDISWGLKLSEALPDLEWLDHLPGKKVLFKGNHDLWWSGITKLNSLYDTITFVQNTAYYCEGLYLCGTRGWITPDNEDFTDADEKVYKRECLRLQLSLEDAKRQQKERPGEILGVLHFPPVSKLTAFSGFQQLFLEHGVKRVIYGHIHGEEGFQSCIQGEYHGTTYHLVSLDHLRCIPFEIKGDPKE